MGLFPRSALAMVVGIIADVAYVYGGSYTNSTCLDPEGRASDYLVGSLPNVTFQLPLNWAGQVPVPGITNDELFFWLFEAENQTQSNDFISEHVHTRNQHKLTGNLSLVEWWSGMLVSQWADKRKRASTFLWKFRDTLPKPQLVDQIGQCSLR